MDLKNEKKQGYKQRECEEVISRLYKDINEWVEKEILKQKCSYKHVA